MRHNAISLLEVLISIFIVSIGLLGVVSLIPAGKANLVAVEKSDRTGACGRAGLHDIRIRGFLGFNRWSRGPAPGVRALASDAVVNTFVIDPLAYAHGNTDNMGPLTRCTLLTPPAPPPPASGVRLSLAQAESIFVWGDELLFDAPKDSTARPRAIIQTDSGQTGSHPRKAEEPDWVPPLTFDRFDASGKQIESANWHQTKNGNFTWFFTVSPAEAESSLPVSAKANYAVSVVVCWKRNFTSGEHTENVTAMSGGIGGGTIQLANPVHSVKKDQWVMLCGQKTVMLNGVPTPANLGRWYRVVSVANETTPPCLSLDGPDWDLAQPSPGTPVTLVAIEGVTGVYESVIHAEN